MKAVIPGMLLVLLIMVLAASPLWARDMRELQTQARQARDALMRKTAAEKAAAEQAAAESRALIVKNRTALKKAIAGLEAGNRRLAGEVQDLTDESQRLNKKEQQLTRKLARTDSMIQELMGVIRINAKDIDTLIAQNLQTALLEKTSSFLAAVAEESRFPGMDDVRGMAMALQNQIKLTGKVARRKGMIVARSGREVEADILLLGPFTAAYRFGDEVGFLNYSAAGGKLYALSRLPSGRMRRCNRGRKPQNATDLKEGWEGAVSRVIRESEDLLGRNKAYPSRTRGVAMWLWGFFCIRLSGKGGLHGGKTQRTILMRIVDRHPIYFSGKNSIAFCRSLLRQTVIVKHVC